MSTTLLDFKDIVDAVMEEMKIQSEDLNSRARIKRIVNQCYLQEVVPYARWKWLEGNYVAKFGASYYGGYASVTPNSTTVTLSVAPSASVGSLAGKYFSTNSFSEVYVIESHVAESTSITLSSEYLGALDATATFKIWTDKIAMPTDCRETVSVWHNMSAQPMKAVGRRELRELIQTGPKTEGYPSFYYTSDFKDSTPLTAETDAERYRELQLFPAVNTKSVTISVDYIKDVSAMSLDGDEPAMPMENRIVLKFGALKAAWRSIGRNADEAILSGQEFTAYLARMAGKLEDAHDTPSININSNYLSRRRAPRYRVGGHASNPGGGSSGGNSAVTYLEDVTINGGNVVNNITVASGKTIDGVDISALDASFSDHLADTSDAHDASAISFSDTISLGATDVQGAIIALNTLIGAVETITLTDNTASATNAVTSAATNTAIRVEYSLIRGASNVEHGTIRIVNDGTNASISQSCSSIGTIGVDFTVDVSGGLVRLRYTTSSTGTDVTMKYTLIARAA